MDIIVAVLLLIAFDRSKCRSFLKRYKLKQKSRSALSEADFCRRLPIDENNSSFVRAIRESLAKRPALYPERIYPEDELWDGFDFEIDDFFDKSTMKFFWEHYAYLSDDVRSVGDLVKFLIRVRDEAKLEGLIKL